MFERHLQYFEVCERLVFEFSVHFDTIHGHVAVYAVQDLTVSSASPTLFDFCIVDFE